MFFLLKLPRVNPSIKAADSVDSLMEAAVASVDQVILMISSCFVYVYEVTFFFIMLIFLFFLFSLQPLTLVSNK